jgi:hypothetical protein
MGDIENWQVLSRGVWVPQQDVLVPWFCSQEHLYASFPPETFWLSEGGCWPTARLKVLGFSAVWGFNFVSVPGRLSEIQFRNELSHSSKRTYRRSRPALERFLGEPNVVNHGLLGQQTWAQGSVRVSNWVAPWSRTSEGPRVLVHHLSVRASSQLCVQADC